MRDVDSRRQPPRAASDADGEQPQQQHSQQQHSQQRLEELLQQLEQADEEVVKLQQCAAEAAMAAETAAACLERCQASLRHAVQQRRTQYAAKAADTREHGRALTFKPGPQTGSLTTFVRWLARKPGAVEAALRAVGQRGRAHSLVEGGELTDAQLPELLGPLLEQLAPVAQVLAGKRPPLPPSELVNDADLESILCARPELHVDISVWCCCTQLAEAAGQLRRIGVILLSRFLSGAPLCQWPARGRRPHGASLLMPPLLPPPALRPVDDRHRSA